MARKKNSEAASRNGGGRSNTGAAQTEGAKDEPSALAMGAYCASMLAIMVGVVRITNGSLEIFPWMRPAQPRGESGFEAPTSRWSSESCGQLPTLEDGIITTFRGAISEAELASVHAAQIEAQRQPHKLDHERSFGYDVSGVKGHNVTFLHTVFRDVAPRLAEKLHCLTLAAQHQRGWGLDDVANKLQPRIVEIITYDAAHTSGLDSNLGWHSDLGSLLTTGLALSRPSAYRGGTFELRDGASKEVTEVEPDAGDVLVWRGWDLHRVTPVTQGRRQVLVIEWWLGPANVDPKILRGIHADANSMTHASKSYEIAVSVDPRNPIAQINLATHLGDSRKNMTNAELGFRRALELAPFYALAHLKLGKVLKRAGREAEALQSMRAAASLEPGNAEFALIAGATATSQGDSAGIAELEAAVHLAPSKAATHHTVATAFASLNRMSEARSCLSRALAIEPSHVESLALDISLGQLDLAERSSSAASQDGNPEIVHAEALTEHEILTMKISELKEHLGRLGLSRSGSRETLQARLTATLARTDAA